MTIDAQIGERIKMARQSMRLTQKELGKKIGKSGAAIAYLEQGKRRATPDVLFAIASETQKAPSFFYEDDTLSSGRLAQEISVLNSQLSQVKTLLDHSREQTTHVQNTLQENEERYKMLIENAPIGIITCDLKGELIDINQCMLDILGSPSAKASKKINVLTNSLLKKAGISKIVKTVLKTGDTVVEEIAYTSMWGKPVQTKSRVAPLHNKAGDIVGVQAIVEDISLEKNYKQYKKAVQKKFYHIFEIVSDPAVLMGPEGKIYSVNEAFETTLGVKSQQLEDVYITSLFQGLSPKHAQSLFKKTLKKGQQIQVSWGEKHLQFKVLSRLCMCEKQEQPWGIISVFKGL